METDQGNELPASDLDKIRPSKRIWWAGSIVLCLVLLSVVIWLWSLSHSIHTNDEKMVDQETVDAFLAENWIGQDQPDAILLPIGVFVQSIRLLNSSDVHVSLYIWQRRTEGVHDHIGKGFILPEQVDSKVTPRREYEIRDGNDVIVSTYYEGTLRQAFDFDEYPFDHKILWIRIWPENFYENVVLVPDFKSYPCPDNPTMHCTGVDNVFGIEESIELGEFTREGTFFDYQLSDYSTNFGIEKSVNQIGFPELRFNVVLKRIVVSAFIINLLPLVVVAFLAFGLLMATTHQENEAKRLGFNALTIVATVAALAFVMLLAQVQMRQEFANSGFVYLELIYFVVYIMLLLVVINAFTVNSQKISKTWVIRYGDNLIAKVSYWPLLLALTVLVTVLSLH